MRKLILISILVFASVLFIVIETKRQSLNNKPECLEEIITLKNNNNDSIELNISNYYDTLIALEVSDPEKVLAQALLETGYFTSSVCRTYNNTLGLYNSYKKDYFKFNSWQESILYYKYLIEYRKKKGEDHFIFLKRIGYAEDPGYINKLKRILKGDSLKRVIN